METSEEFCPIYGSRQWDKLSQPERDELGQHLGSWLFSQFLHGEQGALTVAARIVESVPAMDSKFYAATQAMDEARHVELYSRFLKDKIGLYYPINADLAKLLAGALADSRWDMPYLGMQVLIEGLALAAFGVHRDITGNPLVKQLLAFVMQDEARHVAFGRLALRDYYAQLTEAERADREEFVVEGCYLMRNRFRAQEVWERLGFDVAECLEFTEHSPVQQTFRALLFSRIVPCVKDIGLWGETVQRAYAAPGGTPFGAGQARADQRQAVPFLVVQVSGQRGDQHVDDVGEPVRARPVIGRGPVRPTPAERVVHGGQQRVDLGVLLLHRVEHR